MIESKFGDLEFDFGYYTQLEVNLFFAAGLVGEFQHIGFAVPQQHARFGGAGFADLGFVLLGWFVVAGGGKIGDALAECLCFFVKLPCELLSDFQAAFGVVDGEHH